MANFALGATLLYSAAVLFKHALLTKSLSLFTLHPILSCAFLVLATYGITRSQAIRGPHTFEQRTSKANSHFYAMLSAALLLGSTFAAVYYHKERQGRAHNTTLHEKVRTARRARSRSSKWPYSGWWY